MLLLVPPPHKTLPFYLAMEEYFADRATAQSEEILFLWSVAPTVIIGRHQVLEQEVNIDYCRAHDVAIVRRKSGGGCVYSDAGNLMISFVTPQQHPQEQFERYLAMVAGVLQNLGLPAVTTAHNDILVRDHKVSGNALFSKPTATIVHGTLLLNSNIEELQRCITPSQQKLQKHGVQSVRQRVITLHELGLTNDLRVISSLQHLCNRQRALTAHEVRAIEQRMLPQL